jgi:2-keto-4-pentenoate hydratase/2-oxohepta-3-ene-1,7-dioic acid hydratase in catechol pathway
LRIANVRDRAVLVTGETAGIDIAEASGGRFGPSVSGLYENWQEFSAWAAQGPGGPVAEFTAADLAAPSPSPRQVFAIGLNYAAHAAEASLTPPEEPSVFTKFVSSFTGPCTEVALPAATVDWEVELVVVIGREAKRVSADDAWRYVAGLTVGQDLSERHRQGIGTPAQFSLGKSYPGFSPTGPFLVTPDEVADPRDLQLGCRLNGEEVQQGRTSQMVFSVETLIERLSNVTPLFPGDVIFTGTPAGIGAARNPARFLSPGDELISYVHGIGELHQRFVADTTKEVS